MDIFAVISSLMANNIKKRFKQLVDAKDIDLSLFGSEDKYPLAARLMMGKLSAALINEDELPDNYLDISIYAYLLHSVEAQSPASVIATSLGLEPETAEEEPQSDLGGGTSVGGKWGSSPVSLADANNALAGDKKHTPERFDGMRQESVAMLTANGLNSPGQFDQD